MLVDCSFTTLQISGLTSSGAKVTTSVDVSVGTSDRHCTTGDTEFTCIVQCASFYTILV